ncbi:uncharacterized protein L203_100633 [Cryptococcus depauperatus CBS 7841]|uniref:Uncharacterized protein n=1 Tax=Cryptococcus depauperatus CBS 7841 TaxID=1295531 RepID=A0A1E3IX04_9TREE|nr:hypothetical protein L203_00419 [Cryptococcus depauperatus CBS 7841]ODO02692.1 hypothetical protein L204_01431 [Cryptococcus depauperatus CBS 7855]
MGLFTSSAPAVLHPVNPPIGRLPQYYAQAPTTLVLKEKVFSWTGDSFGVKDTNGNVIVECSGKVMSMRDRKTITDPRGQFLFGLRNKLMSIHKTFIGEDQAENEIFRIRKKLSLGSHIVATFTNVSTNTETTLVLKGDFWGGSADISVDGGPIVAQITRKLFNARELFRDKQTYFVTVAPGVDLALIAAICICFDEVKNDKENNGN